MHPSSPTYTYIIHPSRIFYLFICFCCVFLIGYYQENSILHVYITFINIYWKNLWFIYIIILQRELSSSSSVSSFPIVQTLGSFYHYIYVMYTKNLSLQMLSIICIYIFMKCWLEIACLNKRRIFSCVLRHLPIFSLSIRI